MGNREREGDGEGGIGSKYAEEVKRWRVQDSEGLIGMCVLNPFPVGAKGLQASRWASYKEGGVGSEAGSVCVYTGAFPSVTESTAEVRQLRSPTTGNGVTSHEDQWGTIQRQYILYHGVILQGVPL